MIDTKELRRLAQAATPGGWYVARGNYVYGCKEVTDGEEVWHPVIACTDDDEVNVNFEANAAFIAAANPTAISELLDRLEAAEKDIALKERVIDSLGLALNAAAHERDNLRAEVERLSRYYKNVIDFFANPCERHSGERTPPVAEFFEKYGGQCLICVVDNNKALQAEIEALRAPGAQGE